MSEKEAPDSTVYTRTLRLAAETLGSMEGLARRLGVEPGELARWIAGTEFPPHQMFMRALDIVASGPLLGIDTRRAANKAQDHADRLQASATRVQQSADRAQKAADRAQQRADRSQRAAAPSKARDDNSRLRQVKAKDSAPASNNPEEPSKKSDAG